MEAMINLVPPGFHGKFPQKTNYLFIYFIEIGRIIPSKNRNGIRKKYVEN